MKLVKRRLRHGHSWLIDYRDKYGNRIRKTIIGIKSEKYAQLYFAQFMISYEKGIVGLATDEKITLDEVLTNRIRERELAGCVSRWIQCLTGFKRVLVDHFGEDCFFRDLDDAALAEFRLACMKDGRSVETTQKILKFIVAAASLAMRQGRIIKLPWIKMEMPVDRSGKQTWDFLRADEIAKLLTFLKDGGRVVKPRRNNRNYSLAIKPMFSTYARVMVLIHTGMRFGESSRLKWQDVDLENRVIRVVGTKNAKNGQNAKVRFVPLNEALLTMFAELPKGEAGEAVFGLDGNFRLKFKKALKWAGVREVRVHDLRHSAASHLVMNGSDLHTVAQVLGHSTVQMTTRYAHLDMSHIRQAMNRLEFGQNGTHGAANHAQSVEKAEKPG